ncbi:MAG: hypothetical protein QOI92_3014 [Chloroflexota bacterium]|nr:hypothetical protein [Chloroflexota bacterium]
MTIALVAVILAIGAGAVVAVSTREPAAAAIGLAVALVGSALVADPFPSAAILGVRIVAGLLAATLVRSAVGGSESQPSPLGWPAEAMLATAGAVAGIGVALALEALAGASGLAGGPDSGSEALTFMALATGAGTSLLVLGAASSIHGRPGMRRAIGLVLVTQAVLLIRVGIAGPAIDLEEIARAALLVATAATGTALARAGAVSE